MRTVNMIYNMKKRIFGILLMLTGLCAVAQETAPAEALQRVQYKIDSTTILLGDQTTIVVQPTGNIPTLEDLSNNDIVAVRQWTDSTDGTIKTALTSFEVGEHWLHIGPDSVLITVKDVPNVDTTNTNIKDIANIMRQPVTFGEVAKWVGIVLGICALIAVIIYIIIQLKNRKPIIHKPVAPPIPADEKALINLEQLRQQQLWQQGMVKEYHTELTDIVRNYLEESYRIQSTEMTSDQTLDAFRGCEAYTEDAAASLRQILQTADMVKFAKSEPLPYQHDSSMTQAVAFVRATHAKTMAAHPADQPAAGGTEAEPNNQNSQTK